MTDDTERELQQLLEKLEVEERAISLRRRRLHDRLALYPDYGNDLDLQEQAISSRRRDLHARIDALRAERSDARAADA